MKRLWLAIALSIAIPSMVASPARAAHASALMAVAASLGYTYAYLGSENAITLSRPGVTVLIRPGQNLYDVNDRTEVVGGQAPYFSVSDVFVSDALVKRLREIASGYPRPAMPPDQRAGRITAAASTDAVTGAVSGLAVVQNPGGSTITVDGKAPANVPITLTLVATLSSDIPDVVLSRHRIVSDAEGHFSAIVSVAPGSFTGTSYTVVASSLRGVGSATAQFTVKAPNAAKKSLPGDAPP